MVKKNHEKNAFSHEDISITAIAWKLDFQN